MHLSSAATSSGYGVKTLPGVREAIEQKNWTEADEQIVVVAKASSREADLVAKAADALEKVAATP